MENVPNPLIPKAISRPPIRTSGHTSPSDVVAHICFKLEPGRCASARGRKRPWVATVA